MRRKNGAGIPPVNVTSELVYKREIKFWTRDHFKGCNALKRKINPTRIPIEEKESFRWIENLRQSTGLLDHPERCVHIGDRETGSHGY